MKNVIEIIKDWGDDFWNQLQYQKNYEVETVLSYLKSVETGLTNILENKNLPSEVREEISAILAGNTEKYYSPSMNELIEKYYEEEEDN